MNKLLQLLCKLLRCNNCSDAQLLVTIKLGIQSSIRTQFKGIKMRLTNEQRVTATLSAVTAGGNPARFDGPATFTSSDESVAVVTAVDGVTVEVRAVGLGVAQITATVDADLGEGVRELTATGAVEVVEAEATGLSLTFGEPVLVPVQ